MAEFINVIAGRPGAGKTAFILKDIEDFIRDPEHIAVLIDYKIPSKYTESMPANLRFFDFSHASTGIGWAIDTVNAIGLNGKVRLYYDQNRFSMPHHTREMLVAAGMAGVDVTVTVQKFDQIDEGDITGFIQFGETVFCDVHEVLGKVQGCAQCYDLRILVAYNAKMDWYELSVFVPVDEDAITTFPDILQRYKLAIRQIEKYLDTNAYGAKAKRFVKNTVMPYKEQN